MRSLCALGSRFAAPPFFRFAIVYHGGIHGIHDLRHRGVSLVLPERSPSLRSGHPVYLEPLSGLNLYDSGFGFEVASSDRQLVTQDINAQPSRVRITPVNRMAGCSTNVPTRSTANDGPRP